MQPRFIGISKASSTCTVCRKEGSIYIASDQTMVDNSNVSEEEYCESSEFFKCSAYQLYSRTKSAQNAISE